MVTTCEKCGATAKPGELICEFCEAPVRADAMEHAEICPGCRHPNVQGATACTRCQHVTQCLFCQTVGTLAASSCPRCNEAFAGMAARKKARDDEAERQRLLAIGATVLGTAAPILSSLLGGSSAAPSSPSQYDGGMRRGGGGSSSDDK